MWFTLFPEVEGFTTDIIQKETPHFLARALKGTTDSIQKEAPHFLARALKGAGIGKAAKRGGSGGDATQEEDKNIGLIIGLVVAGTAIVMSIAFFVYRRAAGLGPAVGTRAVHPLEHHHGPQGKGSNSKQGVATAGRRHDGPKSEHDAAIMIQRQWRSRSQVDLGADDKKKAETPQTVATAARAPRRERRGKGSKDRPEGGRYARETNNSELRDAAYAGNGYHDPEQVLSNVPSRERPTQCNDNYMESTKVRAQNRRANGGIDSYINQHHETVNKQAPKKPRKKK